MDKILLSARDKEYLIDLVQNLQQELERKKIKEKRIRERLENSRKHNRNLKEKVNYLRSKIVDFYKEAN